MARSLPSKNKILEYVNQSPRKVGVREIARAFGVDGERKAALKKMLREMRRDGEIGRRAGRRERPGGLPAVAVVEVSGLDEDGEALARPVAWDDDDRPPPVIRMVAERRGRPAPGPGERLLVRLQRDGDGYLARTIRRLPTAPASVLGVFDVVEGQGRIRSTDKRARHELVVATGESLGAVPGELVRVEVMAGSRLGLRKAKIVERLEGDADGSRSVSLIAIHDHAIPTVFPDSALEQAAASGPAPADEREDLRSIPLVTIDGDDARDFDDAVWAAPDTDPANPDGWRVVVAIADVSWYVPPRSPLDVEATRRGNSVYFPDRVVPMLPEALSNGWCSLNPDEDRPCVTVRMWIDAAGKVRRHRFARAVMRSAARLTYGRIQAARDGRPDDLTEGLMDTVVDPLYGAYGALAKARKRRGALELELPERRIVIDEFGEVASIETPPRLDSHKLIEEFMIAANVAAAETLDKRRKGVLYRVHDEPSAEKLEGLRRVLDGIGLKLARGQRMTPAVFNRVLAQAAAAGEARLVGEMVLRSQAQAEYAPLNIGHFGLALRRYCHFTSPIRRYADLQVHRALIAGLGLGEDGPVEAEEEGEADLAGLGKHLSFTERRAAKAERDAVDRFTAAYLAERVGTEFAATIAGATRAGLFVTLEDTGANGLIPIRSLPDDYYQHDERRQALRGRRTGRTYRLGEAIRVRLIEANPLTGGMIMEVVERDASASRRGGRGSMRTGRRR